MISMNMLNLHPLRKELSLRRDTGNGTSLQQTAEKLIVPAMSRSCSKGLAGLCFERFHDSSSLPLSLNISASEKTEKQFGTYERMEKETA